jgi:hypothetical protein
VVNSTDTPPTGLNSLPDGTVAVSAAPVKVKPLVSIDGGDSFAVIAMPITSAAEPITCLMRR